ncbi:terminase large subunit [Caulobacter phage Sansa]|uniref:Terminase large subunit n=1 Tax=Caulobacter phage Sansa TaxID=1675600 RepID=A0A0K1LMR9_9CAUD|nr:terminase large subunit [Caulobacter phage Sansa]AKU43425.1 terminase large subunit [Caulobacter phage Sansa]
MDRMESPFYRAGLTREWWTSLPEEERARVLASWTPVEIEAFAKDWRVWARDQQLPPPGQWRSWILKCGRGFGKNRSAGEQVKDWVESGQKGRICLLGQGEADVRDIMVEGKSGLLAISNSWFRPKWSPSRGGGLLEWPNGAVAHVFSAEDPESVRGHEFDAAWIDEPMSYKAKNRQDIISNLRFALRLGNNPQRIYTMTPKPHKWLRELLATVNPAKGIYLTEGSTYDNVDNLPPAFLEDVTDDYAGTRLGEQELSGILLNDTEDALWTSMLLDRCRIMKEASEEEIMNFAKSMERIVVAVDPNISATGTSHAAGVTVIGRKAGKRYLLADKTKRGGPDVWGKNAVNAYADWNADEIVAEVNQGGDLVKSVIQQVGVSLGIDVPVHKVHATRGKQKRAEPVAAAYEQGRCLHVGPASRYTKVESQMCDLHEGNDQTGEDFDRSDSVVWGMTRLAKGEGGVTSAGGSGIFTFDQIGA